MVVVAIRPTMLRSLVVIGLAALLAPPSASAHVRSGRVAADYEARVLPLRGRLGTALRARIYHSDRALRLTLRGGHSVVVLGYLDEPFLRLDSLGWAANAASPTAASAKLLKKGRATSAPGVHWVVQSTRPAVVWHDARTRGLAPGVKRGRWRVPLIVDASPAALEGEIWRVPRPSASVWLGLTAVLGAALLILSIVRRHDEPVLAALAVIAASATAVTALGFALDSNASGGTLLASADELLFVAIGLAILMKGRGSWMIGAVIGLGFLAIFVAATKGAALFHGVVFSALPAGVARAAIAVGFASGFAAVCAGGVRLLGSPRLSGSDLGTGRASLE